MISRQLNNYDYNRRNWKIAVPHPIEIGNSCMSGYSNYSTLTITADDPYLDPSIVNKAVEEFSYRLRKDLEYKNFYSKSLFSGTYTEPNPILTIKNLEPAYNLLKHNYNSFIPVTKPKHQCIKCDIEGTKEFYEGLLDYYEQIVPEVVEKEKKVCSLLGCLLERIKQNV